MDFSALIRDMVPGALTVRLPRLPVACAACGTALDHAVISRNPDLRFKRDTGADRMLLVVRCPDCFNKSLFPLWML